MQTLFLSMTDSMKTLLLLFLVLTCFTSCQQDVVSQLQNTPYFDLKGLINQQITMLDSLNPPVEILGKIESQQEKTTLHKDSSAWRASLKLFTDADINQPVLQGRYTVEDSTDTQQGLKIRLYRVRNNKDSSIPYMRIYYQDTLTRANVKRIETEFQEYNMLYSTQRKMSASFEKFHGNPRILEYETTGKQKMLFKDSVTYSMLAKIDYPS